MGNLLGEAAPLEYLNADPGSVTVSGYSAGCYMAHRLQIIHSSQIKGAALYSCWPYGTTLDEAWEGYQGDEVDEWFYSSQQSKLETASFDAITEAALDDKIDPTSNLADAAVYIHTGLLDNVVPFWASRAVRGVYRMLGASKIDYEQEKIGHEDPENKMVQGLMRLYIQLGYYSDQSEFEEPAFDYESLGTFTDFAQSEFVGIDSTLPEQKEWVRYLTYWHDAGKIYIPDACYEEQCRVHVTFHDCTSSADAIAQYSQYNNFAASNNIIVVYPETECWAMTWHTPIETWNSTNDDLHWNTQKGLYSRAIMAILCRVTSEDEATAECPIGATALASIGFSLLLTLTVLQ